MTRQIVNRARARAQNAGRVLPSISARVVSPISAATVHPYFDRPVDAAERERVFSDAVELVRRWLPESRGRVTEWADSERAVRPFLAFLDQFPGDSYQDRWMTSGCDAMGHQWAPGYASTHLRRLGARQALNALLILGVIRPSMDWLMASKQIRFWRDWTIHHDPEWWDRFFEVTTREGCTDRLAWTGAQSLIRVCIHHGIGLPEITGQHLLAFRVVAKTTDRANRTLFNVWHHAKLAGLLDGEPDSLTALVNMGQRTLTQLVNRVGITDPGIRQLLIDYVTELSVNNDYSSVDSTSRVLVNLFWRDIQDHHPGQATIALTTEQAAGWKERIKTRPDGAPRQQTYGVLGTVRSFYLDLAAWALEDPARWAPWAVSPPITVRDVRGYGSQRRRVTEKMQDRTRTLAPHLPALAAAARTRHHEAAQLLAAARAAPAGETFTVRGRRYTRLQLSPGANPAAVRVTSPEREPRMDPVLVESQRFWAWAAIEVLRHSGIRIEELLELTHLSIRQYRKPDGQVIPLLQVAPSKSDQERILPASPELTAVLARIISRLTDGGTAVPLAIRRNERELTNSPPMPLLFQLRDGGRSRGISTKSIYTWLADLANVMQLRDVDGQLLRYTPHDFRRLFITDLVTSGFPIHLAATIVGHTSIETTRGYTAIYQKDVFEAYDKFIADRRTLRPSAEYREPTQAEWAEFDEHFMRRKISLGDCRRPYGSGCTHEHACIRCQFLQVDPAQASQLDSIEANLHARVDEARANSWLGDVDQLLVTLEHLEHKKADVQTMLDTLPTPHHRRRSRARQLE